MEATAVEAKGFVEAVETLGAELGYLINVHGVL
jgi:hypothetical protein